MNPSLYRQLGFPPMQEVATLRSIAHLFPPSKEGGRCGVYILAFVDGTHYVGKTVEVVRRFAEHRHRYEIVGFAFIRTSRAKLDDLEREKICLAESLGLRLVNVVHTTVLYGEADLDLVVPEKEQRKWVGSGEYYFRRDRSAPIVLPQPQVDRYAAKMKKFQAHPQSATAVQLLRAYLINCIPAPRRTEYSFWNVSCLPSSDQDIKRLFCVSAASMELFVVCNTPDSQNLWGYVTVSVDALTSLAPDFEKFKKRHTTIDFTLYRYRDAGDDQITLRVWGADALGRLLADKIVQIAGGILAHRVMRKRPTLYAQYHCSQLAQLALA